MQSLDSWMLFVPNVHTSVKRQRYPDAETFISWLQDCVCLCEVCSDRKEIYDQCSENNFNGVANLLVYGPFLLFFELHFSFGKVYTG